MLLFEPVHASPLSGLVDGPGEFRGPVASQHMTWGALSSHLLNLQISHELLEFRVRVAEDRLLILSREHEGTASRLPWLERFAACLRAVFRRFV